MIKKTFILYLSQIYKAILPLVFIPLILNILGEERYGMLSFYYILIGLLGLLDAGISSTFLKFIATNKDNVNNYRKVMLLFFKTLILFLVIAITIQLFFYIKSDLIIKNWLNTKVDYNESTYVIEAIGIVLALLYIKSYLISFLNGMEKQELIAIWSMLYSSIFYFGGYLTIKYIDNSLYPFFTLMKYIAIIDVMVVLSTVIIIYLKHTKSLNNTYKSNERIENLNFRSILKFSIQLSGLSIIWVIATQIDKFVLSNYIPLNEYAKYQIAIQLSSIIMIFSGPITQILLPRLSKLYIEQKTNQFITLYCNSIYIFLFILSPIIPYFFFFGDDLIALWMGNIKLGNEINSYAKWLVSSAFIAATMNFIFILLYTTNKLKHHFYAYAIYSFFTIPLSIFIAKNYGALATAKFTFIHSLIFMLIWSGWQLKKYFTGFILNYYVFFTLILITSSIIFYFLFLIFNETQSLVIKSLLPPIINTLIMGGSYLAIKKKIQKIIIKITLKKPLNNI